MDNRVETSINKYADRLIRIKELLEDSTNITIYPPDVPHTPYTLAGVTVYLPGDGEIDKGALDFLEQLEIVVMSELGEDKEEPENQLFVSSVEKQMIVSPLAIPNKLIYRKDEEYGEYYVYLTPETIEKMAHSFMQNKFTDNINYEHSQNVKLNGISIVELWIKEDDSDKSSKYGFGNLPVGTLFVMMKVTDTNLWKMVKSGEFKGLSLEGDFMYTMQS